MSGKPAILGTAVLSAAFFSLIPGCRPSKILLTPVPQVVEAVEGYAQLRITADGEASRSKFAFAFKPPGYGKIEVSDFFVGSVYQIIIHPEGAYFVLPSKRAYWQGPEEEIIDKFLGFPLRLQEMIFLMTGQGDLAAEELAEWAFDRDSRGRVSSGRRGDLTFRVTRFIGGTSVVAEMEYEHPLSSGRLNIRNIGFNRPVRAGLFSSSFTRTFVQKTWEEIQEMLQRED